MCSLTVVISRFLKKQMVGTHNAVHPFCVNNKLSVPLRLASQQRPYTSITVRGQVATAVFIGDNTAVSSKQDCRLQSCQLDDRGTLMLSCARDTPILRQTSVSRRPRATRARAQSSFLPDRNPRPLSGSQLPSSFCPEDAEARRFAY